MGCRRKAAAHFLVGNPEPLLRETFCRKECFTPKGALRSPCLLQGTRFSRSHQFVTVKRTLKALALLALAICINSCATAFVRSDPPDSVYPATEFDLVAIGKGGVKGDPPFAAAPGERSSVPARIIITLGGLIDLPYSLVFDTLFLPFDVYRLTSSPEEESGADESDTQE